MSRDLEIDLLRTLAAVADCRTFTGAARTLCRTQSAVSAQIRRLEEIAGTRLFERDSRHVALTETGEALLHHARRILARNDEALAELNSPGVEGTVALGIPDDYAAYFLPRALAGFGATFPAVSLDVCCELSTDLLPLLRDGKLDLCLTTRQPTSAGGEALRCEPLVWAASRANDMPWQSPLPLALFPPGYCAFREAALTALRDAGLPWRIVCTSRSLSGIRAAVSAGLAVTVVTASTLSPDMHVLGPEQGFPPLPEVEIALHLSREPLPEPARLLASFLKETLREEDVPTGPGAM